MNKLWVAITSLLGIGLSFVELRYMLYKHNKHLIITHGCIYCAVINQMESNYNSAKYGELLVSKPQPNKYEVN